MEVLVADIFDDLKPLKLDSRGLTNMRNTRCAVLFIQGEFYAARRS